MNNPVANMYKYASEDLEKMSLEELLATQRDCLFPEEQVVFDKEESVIFKRGDKREEFFDFIDQLICNLEMRKSG